MVLSVGQRILVLVGATKGNSNQPLTCTPTSYMRIATQKMLSNLSLTTPSPRMRTSYFSPLDSSLVGAPHPKHSSSRGQPPELPRLHGRFLALSVCMEAVVTRTAAAPMGVGILPAIAATPMEAGGRSPSQCRWYSPSLRLRPWEPAAAPHLGATGGRAAGSPCRCFRPATY
jgi:hypothetical protein